MNRRELFQVVAGVASTAGVTVQASTIDADAKPAFALIEVHERVSHDTAARILQNWEALTAGTVMAGVKALVLDQGMTLTLLDANGRPLNRRVEDDPA